MQKPLGSAGCAKGHCPPEAEKGKVAASRDVGRVRRADVLRPDGGSRRLVRSQRSALASAASTSDTGGAFLTSSRYITGVTTRLKTVDEISPPMITQASGA